MSQTKKLIAISVVLILSLLPIRAATLTSLQTDTFTRANASTLGVNWAAVNNSGFGCQILSNQARPSATGGFGECMFTAGDWPNDQGVQCTTATIASLGSDISGCVVRGQFWVNATSGYFAGSFNTADSHVHLVRMNAGFTNIATSADNIAAGDTIQIQTVGCNPVSITVLHNGTPEAGMNPFTDSTATALCAGSPGVGLQSSTSTSNAGVTNWTGYAVTTPPTINNSSPFPILGRGTFTSLGNLTGASQALQFTLPSPTVSRIQLIVQSGSGTAANPIWVLECSQDSGTTWFQVYGLTLPTLAPQLGDIFPLYAPYYDVYGLGGASCRFGLGATTGSVTGTLPVFVTIG